MNHIIAIGAPGSQLREIQEHPQEALDLIKSAENYIQAILDTEGTTGSSKRRDAYMRYFADKARLELITNPEIHT